MSNLQPNCCLKVDFQKVDQHAGSKCLIHATKRHKDNQLQSLKLSFWTRTKVIRMEHIIQPTGFGACSSTCCQKDGEDLPA